MNLASKPSHTEIESFLDIQRAKAFSYPSVGSTRSEPPKSFDVDRNRVLLGHGEVAYITACEALRKWRMFPDGWTELVPTDAPQTEGVTLAMLARCFGMWWLNACRIVYSLDESGPCRRYGFAYGTLPGHVECGEERFLIEWDKDDQVWYELYSFSRPRHWLVRLCYPLARRLQKKFVTQSLAQMQKIVAKGLLDNRNEALVSEHALRQK